MSVGPAVVSHPPGQLRLTVMAVAFFENMKTRQAS